MSIMHLNSNTANAWLCQPVFGTARSATLTIIADTFRTNRDRHRIFDHLNKP
jgi:hypothetical protein